MGTVIGICTVSLVITITLLSIAFAIWCGVTMVDDIKEIIRLRRKK
jgi:hypothetical protein